MEIAVQAVTAAVALAALAVSIVVARRQTAIQERLASIEEARREEEVAARGRARVTARVERGRRDHRGRDVWLMLLNEGPALARDVLAAATEEGPGIPGVIGLERLPTDLQPGQEVQFAVEPAMWAVKGPPKMPVVVSWTDEAGDHEETWMLHAG